MVSQSKQLTELKRHWKGTLLDYDFLLDCDTVIQKYICLNERERQILLAAIAPLAWKTRYYSDTQEIDIDTVEGWHDDLVRTLLEGCMTCGDIQVQVDVQYQTYILSLVAIYDGTPSSVNEQCPDDNFNGDGSSAREMALCMALNAWCKAYCNAWLRKAALILGLGILGVFLFAIPVLGWVAVAVIGGLAFVSSTYYDALEDETAIENVACCWYNELLDTAITKANWASTLAACEFDDGSNELLIQSVISSELGYDKQWVSFLDALGNAYPIAQAGAQDCPCTSCETEWTQYFLGGYDNQDWFTADTLDYGEYDAVNDRLYGENRVVSGAWNYWELIKRMDFDPTVITKIEMDIAYNSTYSSMSYQLGNIYRRVPTPGTTLAYINKTSPGSGTLTLSTGDICQEMEGITLRATTLHPDGALTGYVYITQVRISGVGVNPFV